MALIPCPECQQQVSSQAATCPHCGIAIAGNVPSAGSMPMAAALPVATVAEQTLWQGHPSLMILLGKAVVTLVLAVGLPCLAYAGYSLAVGGLPPGVHAVAGLDQRVVATALWAAVGLIVVYRLAGLVLAGVRVRSLHYRLTNQRLVIESGILAKALQEIDLRYVDDVSFSQGVVQRVLGLGEVVVVSSDKLVPRLVMAGIGDPRALRELIRAHAYAVSQRQFFPRAT